MATPINFGVNIHLFNLKAPITTVEDDKFCDIFSNFGKSKVRYFMRIVCQQTILMQYHVLYVLFLKKQQNFKLSSAANYRWRFRVNVMFKEDSNTESKRICNASPC